MKLLPLARGSTGSAASGRQASFANPTPYMTECHPPSSGPPAAGGHCQGIVLTGWRRTSGWQGNLMSFDAFSRNRNVPLLHRGNHRPDSRTARAGRPVGTTRHRRSRPACHDHTPLLMLISSTARRTLGGSEHERREKSGAQPYGRSASRHLTIQLR